MTLLLPCPSCGWPGLSPEKARTWKLLDRPSFVRRMVHAAKRYCTERALCVWCAHRFTELDER